MKKFYNFLFLPIFLLVLILASCEKECSHNFGEWEKNGEVFCIYETEVRLCKKCGFEEKRNNTESHAFGEWSIKIPAGCTESGINMRICSRCLLKEESATPAKGHSGSVVCNDCRTSAVTLPNLNSADYKSAKISISELKITLNGYGLNNGEGTMDLAEGYFTLDENNMLTGYASGVIEAEGNISGIKKNTKMLLYAENDKIYLIVTNPEILLDSTKNSKSISIFDIESIPELKFIKEELLFICSSFEEIKDWYSDILLPLLEGVYADSSADDFLIDLINSTFKRSENDEGFSLAIDLQPIIILFEDLDTKTLKKSIDMIFGEKCFENVKKFLCSDDFYSMKVSEVMNYLATEQDVDLIKLFSAFDELIKIYTSDEKMTLEKHLKENGVPLADEEFEVLFNDSEFLSLSVFEALEYIFEENIDVETLKSDIIDFFNLCEDKTLFEIIQKSSEESKKKIDSFEEMLTMLYNNAVLTLNFDKEGFFTYADSYIKTDDIFTLPGSITLKITEKNISAKTEINNGSNYSFNSLIVPLEEYIESSVLSEEAKKAISSIPTLSSEVIIEVLSSSFSKGLHYIEYNEEENILVAVEYLYHNKIKNENGITKYDLAVNAYKIDLNKTSITQIHEGCSNALGIYFDIPIAKSSAIIFTDIEADINETARSLFAFFGKDKLISAAKEADFSSPSKRNYKLLYDIADGEIISTGSIKNYGHKYILEDKTQDGEIICEHYKCSECEEEYFFYYK